VAHRDFLEIFYRAHCEDLESAPKLHVDLVREIPEAMKPRAIPIASSVKVLNVEPTKVAA